MILKSHFFFTAVLENVLWIVHLHWNPQWCNAKFLWGIVFPFRQTCVFLFTCHWFKPHLPFHFVWYLDHIFPWISLSTFFIVFPSRFWNFVHFNGNSIIQIRYTHMFSILAVTLTFTYIRLLKRTLDIYAEVCKCASSSDLYLGLSYSYTFYELSFIAFFG